MGEASINHRRWDDIETNASLLESYANELRNRYSQNSKRPFECIQSEKRHSTIEDPAIFRLRVKVRNLCDVILKNNYKHPLRMERKEMSSFPFLRGFLRPKVRRM